MTDLYVEAINKKTCMAILSDGQLVSITHWFYNGDECEPEDAGVCVCGPCNQGMWYVVELIEMSAVPQ
jgi:hypothetical protein